MRVRVVWDWFRVADFDEVNEAARFAQALDETAGSGCDKPWHHHAEVWVWVEGRRMFRPLAEVLV